MSIESAYNKRLGPESTVDKVEAVLEHINVPQPVIQNISRNARIITWLLILLVIFVVSFSLWRSSHQKKIQHAASTFAAAISEPQDQRKASLEKIIEEYGSTTAATWAKVELARFAMTQEKFKDAADRFGAIRGEISESDPLYGLLLYGEAQALEGAKDYTGATALYHNLQNIVGYEFIGFYGEGRILEEQSQTERALAIYNDYVVTAGDDPNMAQNKQLMQSRIEQIKAVIAK
ncbi:MAG: tetratricopeptide repeat protein [Desulforhopalus sp.]|nr:tetratricopeptide repeat protein [Desulforhopalus sp.]